ncbi:hypothetical protein BDY19DRAFT_729528 [Irpex rosettiformis]|uniref:Uncharacterized protein n=1 Tax=Irpex rosettiformis TaxID=378272 RepID=A0ACB8U8V1_9APHY|nr:hypothetical protein BDY19DRAFT_729528 [Irpex rosettiformis]
MSKPSAASATKLPQFPQKSAWARGPPNTSSTPTPRSQSPAPTNVTSPVATSHSRRPSTLGQAVAFKDGARSPVSATQSASAVTFGSIDDAAATISSSPASVPPIKTEVPKAFGSVSATPSPVSTVNGKQPASSSASVSSTVKPSSAHHVTKPAGFNVKSLFMTHSSGPMPSSSSSQSSSDPAASASPSTRPAPLPSYPSSSQPSHTPQSAQFPSHSFQTFVPGSGLRPQPNGATTNGPPRSPVYSRPTPNGVAPPVGVNGRPQGPPGPPAAPPTPLSANMPSPRMSHPHPAAQPQMPPGQQPVPWQYYYPYPSMPPEYMYTSGWLPQHVVPPGQHPHTPGVPQPPPHQPPHPHTQPGIPMSPRHPPSNLHPPGTPNLTPSVPSPALIPSPHLHSTPLSSVSSPPATPASSNGPSAATMDRNAKPFVPGRSKVVIKNEQGVEVVLDSFKKHSSQSSISGFQSPVVPSSPARMPIRMETEEAKMKRLEEEERQKKEKEDAEKAKKEAEEKAKRDEEERIRKEKAEEERKQKEEEQRIAKEEEDRKKEEAEQRKKKQEEEERIRREEEEKRRKEEEEKEKVRKEEEERERLKLEEEGRAKREKDEKEKEARERAVKEAEVVAPAEDVAALSSEGTKDDAKEEGEIDESEKAAENDETRDKVSDRPPLRLNTTLDRKRPGPLDLSGTKEPIAPALPSALASARIIDDINRVEYPEGIRSPKVELNVNAKDGKFKYDRDFLLQFMAICKEKPDSLPPLDAIGLEPSDQSYPISRGGSGRRQSSISMGPPSSNAPRQAVHGLGITGGKPGFTMGQFSTPSGAKVGSMSSEDRFAMSNRTTSMSGASGMPFGARPSPISRSSSQGGPGGVPMGSNRTRSKRGEKRNTNSNAAQSFANASASLAAALEPVAPLEVSANRWTPNSLVKKPVAVSEDSPEVVERKVKGLLNKLTMERFDSISDQIIAWANRSEKEKDGRTLIQVIKLVFEKATDEATWSEMYARLCRKMMEQISPKVQDDGIRNSEGKHITGGHLFRKYLLNRCQEDFERGWASKESTAAAAAGKASEDEAAKAASGGDDEAALYSEEYYAAQKAKRQGLGLIKFIGELFKLQMLTERIMHECVKKLLGNVANPEEEEIESLCKLLSTVGSLLDTPKARAHMDVYFSRMKELTKSGNVNSRMQFMLLDVLELRARNWIPRNQIAAPTTIAAVHELAAKEKAVVDTQRLSMSRGGSRRGNERGDSQPGADGWAVAGGSQPRPPAKAGDLSQFGKISKSGPMTFGPSGIFANKEKGKRDSTIPRGGNMFSMLSQNSELASEVQAPSSKSSRPPSRKPSIDLGSGGIPEPSAPAVRRKLVLQPRTLPKPDDTSAASVAGSDDEGVDNGAHTSVSTHSMTKEQALKQIDEDIKELLSIRNVDEAEEYFVKLPAEHRHLLVDKLVAQGVEAKEDVVDVIGQVFARAANKDLCSPAHFEQGFLPTAELIDDIAIDAPKAFTFFAKLLKSAGLDKDAERREHIATKSLDSEKLLNLLTS